MFKKLAVLLATMVCALGLMQARAETEGTNPDRIGLLIEPYSWLTYMTGTITAAGTKHNVSFNLEDLMSLLDELFFAMGRLELSKGKFTLLYDGFYVSVEDELNRSSSGVLLAAKAKVKVRQAIQELALGYRIGDWNNGEAEAHAATLDLIVGARDTYMRSYNSVTATVDLPVIGRFNRSGESCTSREWINAFIGGRLRYEVNERTNIGLRADVGGFGLQSDFTWNTIADMRYFVTKNRNAFLSFGYRAYGDYYSDDDFKYKIVMHGPVLGGGFVF